MGVLGEGGVGVGGLESGSEGRAWGGREWAGEVEREPSLHHPSRDSSALLWEKGDDKCKGNGNSLTNKILVEL